MADPRRQRSRPTTSMRTSNSVVPATTKNPCCCSIPVLLVLLTLTVVAGGIILWQFLPQNTKQQVQNVLPGDAADQGEDALDDVSVPSIPNINVPTFVGGDAEPPEPSFAFNTLCGDDTSLCCNGLVSNCDRRVNEILFAGLHNAGASVEDGFYLSGNHDYSLEKALDAGYRGINLDIAKCDDGALYLIHGTCKIGWRDPKTVFTNMGQFLADNPREVFVVTMEIVDIDGVQPTLDEIYAVMQQAPLFAEQMYWHDDEYLEWPTLSQLIEMQKRVLFFYYGINSCKEVSCPQGFQSWFQYATETPYSFEETVALAKTQYSCALDRGRLGPQRFYGINLFVTNPLPSKTSAETLNSKDYLQSHIQACEEATRLNASVVWIDFWHVGDLVEVVQLHNANLPGEQRRRKRRHQ